MRSFTHDALPGRVVFGPGAALRLVSELERLSAPRRVLLIVSGSAKATGERLAEQLGIRHAGTWGEVRQHVPEELADRATSAARTMDVEAVVAIGGGSAIGLAKVVAVRLNLALAAVPTTYSGSEMTPIYGLTGERKRTERNFRALPRLVLYDPELTLDMPIQLTTTSGFNALAHCVEGLYAPGTNPVVALWAEEGIRRLARALPQLASDPATIGARSEALYGAYLGGSVLAVAGTALQHKLSHVLGGRFGLDHAGTHTVLLPHITAFNAAAVPDAIAPVASALGDTGASGRAWSAAEAGCLLYDLATGVEAPTSLAALGMPEDGIDEVAALAVGAVGDSNPRAVDESDLRGLLRRAFQGGRPVV